LYLESRVALELTLSRIQQVPRAVSSRVKPQGREAEHSPPSIVEVTNSVAIPPLLHTHS
jgi:hypothetical protein